MSDSRGAAHWRANRRLILVLLIIWATVSIGCGILLVEPLNQFRIGELPLGFWIAYLLRPRPALAMATLACAGLSLGIENLQCYLDGRNATIDDVLLNTLGGSIGACLGRIWGHPVGSSGPRFVSRE